jgi:hypothetical protein
MIQASEAVQNGVEWLDAHIPDWYDFIDVDNLNLRNGYCCILGQLFSVPNETTSGFVIALNAFEISLGCSIEMGFEATNLDNYDELYDEWVKVIEERKGN